MIGTDGKEVWSNGESSLTWQGKNGVHEGLNVVENWNATNDFICYGRQGELAIGGSVI
jgi:hypothetical protein